MSASLIESNARLARLQDGDDDTACGSCSFDVAGMRTFRHQHEACSLSAAAKRLALAA